MNTTTSIETALHALNTAFKADPNAIHALIVNRVPCNGALLDHPTVQVKGNQVLDGETYFVTALGLLNGVIEPLTGERVAATFSDDESPRFLGFVKYERPLLS